MTPDEIAAARKLAKGWTRENPVLIASRLSDTIERLCDEVERLQRELGQFLDDMDNDRLPIVRTSHDDE